MNKTHRDHLTLQFPSAVWSYTSRAAGRTKGTKPLTALNCLYEPKQRNGERWQTLLWTFSFEIHSTRRVDRTKVICTTTVMFLNTVREQTALDCNSLFGKPGDAVVSPPVISPIEQQCTHKHF